MPGLATETSSIARGRTNLGTELELFIAWRRVPMVASCQKRMCRAAWNE